MTNNSPVYWDIQRVDGTWMSLHTYAWSVKSFGGRRWVAGAKRGDNISLPHRQGRIFVPKLREAQTFDLNMWVFPIEDNGRRPLNKTIEQKSHENWRMLIDAFDQEGQFRIRKRWHRDNSIASDFGSSAATESAVGLAEFLDASGPDSDDGRGFYGNISLSLADPYFYGNQLIDGWTAASKVSQATPLGVGSNNVNLIGEAPTSHIWIVIENPNGTNPRITFPDGNWIQLLGESLDPLGTYVIDCQTGLAVESDPAAYLLGTPSTNNYINGLIRRNPYFQNWPRLDPNKYPTGPISRDGDGMISVIYDPAYR